MLNVTVYEIIVYDFSCELYIVYFPFINSSSKNNSVEVEFYRKKIINQHFFSRKSRSHQKRNVRDLRLIKKINCAKKIE